jgi:ATP-dependent DNA helicase RecG
LLKKELQIFTFNDLLFHLPYRHVDRSKIYKINELRAELPYVQVKGIVSNLRLVGKNRAQRLVADLKDETGVMELVWFQGIKWVKESVVPGKIYLAFGKPAAFSGSINIAHPTLDDPDEAAMKKYLHMELCTFQFEICSSPGTFLSCLWGQ